MSDPKAHLDAGIASMRALLAAHGLDFVPGAVGRGSGGPCAQGELVAGPCRVRLSYRYGLGDIHLEAEGRTMTLDQYLRASGVYHDAEYPSSRSGDPQQFSALAHDLHEYCSEFLAGDPSRFLGVHREWEADPGRFRGLRGLPG